MGFKVDRGIADGYRGTMKLSDLLIFVGVLAVGGALALLLGGGLPSQAVMTLASIGSGAYVGTRMRERRKSRG